MVFTQKKEVPPEPELGPGWRKVEVKKDNRVVKAMTKYWNPQGEELSFKDVKKILDSLQGKTNIDKGFKRTCAEAEGEAGWTEEGQRSGMRAGPGDFAGAGLEAEWRRGYGGSFGRDGPERGGRGFWLWWHERHDGGFYDMKGGGSSADRGEGFKGLHPGSNGGQYVVSSNANNSVRKSLGPYSIRYTPTGFINQGAPPDEEKVDALLKRTKYRLSKKPGQRSYRAPDFADRKAPASDAEVFIGNLPRDMYEDTLIPLLEAFGTLREVKLKMDPASGLGRGFCFVVYTTGDEARRCVEALKNYQIAPNHKLRVNFQQSERVTLHKELSSGIGKMAGTVKPVDEKVWSFSDDGKVKCSACPPGWNSFVNISRLKKHFNMAHKGLSSTDGRCSGCNQLLSIDAIVAGHDCPTPTASSPHHSHKYSSAYNNLTPEQRQKVIQDCAMGKIDPKEISMKWLCKLSKIRKWMKESLKQNNHSSGNPSLSALSPGSCSSGGTPSAFPPASSEKCELMKTVLVIDKRTMTSKTKDADTSKATPRKPRWTAKQKKEVKARKKELNGKMKEEVKPSAKEYVKLSSDDALLEIETKEEYSEREIRKRKQEVSFNEFSPKMELKEEIKEEPKESARDLLGSLSSAGGLKEEYSERETKRCKQEISLGNLEIKKGLAVNVKEETKEITEGNLEIKKEFVINVKEEAEEITEEDSEPFSDARSAK